MPQIPYILSVVTFLPLVGAGLILLARLFNKAGADGAARWIALLTTLVTLAVSVVLVANFDPSSAAYQFVERYVWFVGAQYHMGVDGISILFVLLTAFLMPICILASWTTIKDRVVDYMIAFLVLETLVIGVFTSLDLFLFYMFFEGTLVPMFIIIGVWGGANRIYASYKFFLYTLLGSVLMLLAMLWMAAETGTTSIPALKAYAFSPTVQPLLWLAFFASFAVKMPMWPVHTWLPDAHVQAPTAGSVILAGILLVNHAEIAALTGIDPSTGSGHQSALSRLARGAMLALVAVVCWTWYPISNARWMQRNPKVSASTWATAQGLTTLPLALVAWGLALVIETVAPSAGGASQTRFDFPLGQQALHFVLLMTVLGLVSSWLGTRLWNQASRLLPTSLTGQLIVFETLAALAYGYAWRGDWPAPTAALGICLLIAGVAIGANAFRPR